MLSDADRDWLETKFQYLHEEMRNQGSKIHKHDMRLVELELNSPHKCAESIKAHEQDSWSHNPKKAIGLGVSLVTLYEGVKSLFHH